MTDREGGDPGRDGGHGPCRVCDGVGDAIGSCPCSRCEGARRHALAEHKNLVARAALAEKMSKVLAAFRRGKDKTLMSGFERTCHEMSDELLEAYALLSTTEGRGKT